MLIKIDEVELDVPEELLADLKQEIVKVRNSCFGSFNVPKLVGYSKLVALFNAALHGQTQEDLDQTLCE